MSKTSSAIAPKQRDVRFGMMRRVIYTSKSRVIDAPSRVDEIVALSSARNRDTGITGMLWFDGANFAQALEGDPNEVGKTMDRIRNDPRHEDIDVVFDRLVASRLFGDWSMRRPDDDVPSTDSTGFLIGFAVNQRTKSAQRLYEIVAASDG